MKQILIEKNGVEHIMNIPDGSNVTIDGNVIVFEPKFKKGDIILVKFKNGNLDCTATLIFNFIKDDECHYFYSTFSHYNGLFYNYVNTSDAIFEKADEEIALLMFEDLRAEGKQWNAEKLCIEDLKWNPKIGELFYYFDDELDLCSDAYNKLGYSITIKCGNCFKTKELCQRAIDKIKQVLSEK